MDLTGSVKSHGWLNVSQTGIVSVSGVNLVFVSEFEV